MNKLIILQKITAIVSALRPFFFAVIGGLTVTTVNRCSDQKPVNLIVTNQNYENQLRNIQKKQDSISNALPNINQSLRYLSERYDGSQGKFDR